MKTLKMKSPVSFALLFFIGLGVLSCSKDSDDPTPVADSSVEGSWKISAMTIDPAQDGISDILAYYEALAGNNCITQSTFIFKNDGSIGGQVPAGCSGGIGGSLLFEDSATWKVKDGKIQITEGTDVSEYALEVNKTEMKWLTEEEDAGVKYKITVLFKRQ